MESFTSKLMKPLQLKLMTFSQNWEIRLVFTKGRYHLATTNFLLQLVEH